MIVSGSILFSTITGQWDLFIQTILFYNLFKESSARIPSRSSSIGIVLGATIVLKAIIIVIRLSIQYQQV